MSDVPAIALNDGRAMPALGFGVWQIPDDEAERTTLESLAVGYRSIDTAQYYANEAGVGRAIARCGIPRDEIFLTTKVWNSSQGRDRTRFAFDESMAKLGTDYLDLYLIHWPSPKRGLYVETWKALIELKKEGRVRSIGVSNFGPNELAKILDETGEKPVVNQIELHPRFQQRDTRAFHEAHGIATEAWSPLGQGKLLRHPVVTSVATKHQRSSAQVLLRWHLRHHFIVIPKSATPSRIRENFDVLGFDIDDDDMRALDALDSVDGRIGPDPYTATF
ncbi:MAG TPA: aldo/keto reductase [Labilithrix sp.]|nr:aldo/keto reductase [Labilithrix sp.]